MRESTTRQFRNLLSANRTEFLMEAHDGLSAKIVEEAEFKGIWASGLCISASLGVRDNNEASWTQVLDVVEYMTDAASIPILLDADTGYGNFNNVRRLVRKLEQRRVAAMCIEDKLFPKTNSFIDGEQQPLADIGEFAGKIKAAKDTQQDEDFAVVARIEALIAGWGLDEALRRATAYYRAGADAILIHSKSRTADQILAFMQEWGHTCPVVIVPTTYCSTPTEVFEDAGVRLVIWANHLLRTSITAMQSATAMISRERSVAALEPSIASVHEVFRLQNADELKAAERLYLPAQASPPRAIILPSLSWTRADERDDSGVIQGLVPHPARATYRGRSLIHWQVTHLREVGVRDVLVIPDLPPDDVARTAIRTLPTPSNNNAPPLATLRDAIDGHNGDLLVCTREVLVRPQTFTQLLQEPGEIVLLVDVPDSPDVAPVHFDYLVRCDRKNSRQYSDERCRLTGFSPEEPHGEWIGIAKLGPAGLTLVRQAIDQLQKRRDFQRLEFRDLLAHLAETEVQIDVVFIHGQWLHSVATVSSFESDSAYASQSN